MIEMTVEQKKDYLELYALQQARINSYYTLSAMNTDKKSKYKRKLDRAMMVRDVIEHDIEKLKNAKESVILSQRYLCGKTLGETAEMLNYSRRQVERLHLSGLEHLKPSLEKIKKKRSQKEDGTDDTAL